MASPSGAESMANKMQVSSAMKDAQSNDEILGVIYAPIGKGWLLCVLAAITAFTVGIGAFLYQTYWGLGVAGYSHPIFWGVYIVTFVFWIGNFDFGDSLSLSCKVAQCD